jgi:autotransporter-associated beta strand protein
MAGFWGVRFQLPSWVQGELRRRVTALAAGVVLAAASLVVTTPAQAQSFTWNGASTDYNAGGNWTPPAGPPPVVAGQSAVFDTTGSIPVSVTTGPIAPDSWTFTAASQSYSITGAAVNFSLPGASGGIIDNASSGQTISIANSIGESVAGVQVQLLGSSLLILSGTNTYSGGTIIGGGCTCAALQLGDPTHTGSIIGTVTNGGTFGIVNANTAGITSINNDGGLMQVFGTNTFAAPTITNKNFGETDFNIQSNAGNATIVNRTGGTTTFNDASSAMNANITNKVTGGSTLFFATSSAGNAVITNNSSSSSFGPPIGLGFFDGSTAGNATITNTGSIAFGTPFSFGGVDTATAGNANITNNSGGQLQFDAFTTAGNAIIVTNNGGAVAFFDSSTAGSATIIVNSGGSVTFFDSSSGGTAQFIANGTGIVDFGGGAGSGPITAGSIAGSGIFYIGGGNTLIVGGNNLSTEVSGVIADFNPCGCGPAGSGALTKVGTGTLTLSGINTYTGPTVVDGGILSVNGSIVSSSSVTVNAGGTLGGNGIVGNTTINGGTLSPGNSVGLLTVQGSLVFTAASTYLVEVSTAADRTSVTGTATPGGSSVNAMLLGGNILKQYTILNATGGVVGTFNPLVNVNVPNFVGRLTYDPNDVFLNFSLNFNPSGGLNVNQRNVANVLTNFFNANGGIPLVFGALTPAGLTQVSGETATGSQQATFEAMNLFMGLLTDPFIDGRGASGPPSGGATPFAEESDPIAYAAKRKDAARDAFAKIPTKAEAARNNLLDPHWSVWGAAYGGGATTDGSAALGSNSATARAFGFVAGADYRISPATLAGFALAGGGTNFSVNGFGTGRSDLFQAGAFVRHTVGAAYVSGALAYGWQDVTTDRTVTVAGLDRLHAEFNANAYSGRVEGGYRYLTPWMGVTPYAAGQFTTFSLPAYAEQVLAGTNTFALNYSAKDVTASRSELGVRTDKSFAMQNAILTLRGRFAWAHDFNTDRNISAVFQTLPGAAFVVSGAAQAHDSALTTASVEMKWLNGWSAAAAFEGEFSNVTASYAGKGVMRYTW